MHQRAQEPTGRLNGTNAVVSIALISALLASSSHGQVLLLDPASHPDLTAPSVDELGSIVVSVEDLDGDAVRDLAVSSSTVGYVRVLSGRTGVWIGTVPTAAGFTALASPGDLDGDGIPELLVGFPSGGQGRVEVYSLADFALSKVVTGQGSELRFGYAMQVVGDVSGDGIPEVAVGAPGSNSNAGLVATVDVLSEARVQLVTGPQPNGLFGSSLQVTQDLDGLGEDDLLVGAPGNWNGQVSAGAVFAVSLDTGSIWSRSGAGQPLLSGVGGEAFGEHIAPLDDLDGDGVEEFVCLDAASSLAIVYSPGAAAVVRTLPAEDSVVGLGDLDGDGSVDFALPQPTKSVSGGVISMATGAVRLVSGRTGEDIAAGRATLFLENFGHSVSNVGDLNGDGHPEYCVTSLRWDPDPLTLIGSQSIVGLYSGQPAIEAPNIRETILLAAGATRQVRFFFSPTEFAAGTRYQIAIGDSLSPSAQGWVQAPLLSPNMIAIYPDSAEPTLTLQNVAGHVGPDGWVTANIGVSSSLGHPGVIYLEARGLDTSGNWKACTSGLEAVVVGTDIVPTTSFLTASVVDNYGERISFVDLTTGQALSVGDLQAQGAQLKFVVHLGGGSAVKSSKPKNIELPLGANGDVDWSPLAPIIQNCWGLLLDVTLAITLPSSTVVTVFSFGASITGCLNTFLITDWAWQANADFSNWGAGSTFGGWKYATAIVGKTFDNEAYGLLINQSQVNPFKSGTATSTSADATFHNSSCPGFWPGDHALYSDLSTWGLGNLHLYSKVTIGFCAGSCNGNGQTCGSIKVGSAKASKITRFRKWSEI